MGLYVRPAAPHSAAARDRRAGEEGAPARAQSRAAHLFPPPPRRRAAAMLARRGGGGRAQRAEGGGSTPARGGAQAAPIGARRSLLLCVRKLQTCAPGSRKCTIPREPPAPRRRASLKPSRALGYLGPPAAAPLKPWVKTLPPDGNELPSLGIFCSLACANASSANVVFHAFPRAHLSAPHATPRHATPHAQEARHTRRRCEACGPEARRGR